MEDIAENKENDDDANEGADEDDDEIDDEADDDDTDEGRVGGIVDIEFDDNRSHDCDCDCDAMEEALCCDDKKLLLIDESRDNDVRLVLTSGP